MVETHLTDKERKENLHALALDRTVYAFERTALAYMRTGATFFIAGVSLMKFFSEVWVQIFGGILILPSIYMVILGLRKYKETNAFIGKKR